ncbi:MAG TPA: PilZ domain-containing protein [Gemmataceae bacterium]|nr:PilZ domain-containing protein [Gemmataceae bacterium]
MAEPIERRRAERFPVNSSTTCVFLAPVGEDFGPVKIQNISTDGIGLLVTRRVEPGVLLAVTLSNPARNFTKTVLVRVVHATAQHGSAYLVGGTLNVPLTYEELSTLVL